MVEVQREFAARRGDLVNTDKEEGSEGTKNELDFADDEDDLTTAQQCRTHNVPRHSIGGTENPYHPDFPPKPDPSTGLPRPLEMGLPKTLSPFTSSRLEASQQYYHPLNDNRNPNAKFIPHHKNNLYLRNPHQSHCHNAMPTQYPSQNATGQTR